jgi:hypothetical protein
MIVYVNGDSNTAAGEAVNDHCFAQDDPKWWSYGRSPHPDNLAVSWGKKLADKLDATLHCDAESASSNSRMIRTTYTYLKNNPNPALIVIGWSTWEREEWHGRDGNFYQVNAGGIGEDWPDDIKERYKEWIVNIDYQAKMNREHLGLYNLHSNLLKEGINHYFFNCYEPCTNVVQFDWHNCYLEPYNLEYTYFNWCKNQGFKTTKPNGYHYGADAHAAWAEFLYPKIVQSCLTK